MIEVRVLTTTAEYAEAVRLQKTIWGFDDIDVLPVRLFVVASKVGGQTFGAYDGTRMVGFCLAIPGLKAGGKNYLHSHMMGVLADYRNLGVGRMMKLRQREDALLRGLELIEWTFDPLEIKNAYFNIERLGAVISRYVLNQYGTTTSLLHSGLPTDRCVAEWWIRHSRVKTILNGTEWPQPEVAARIPVPSDIEQIRRSDPHRAREIQQRVSSQFVECLNSGLVVTGFERTPENGTYLLSAGFDPHRGDA
jgi:predicted GNAT superfamily acetyltransferase